VVRPPSAAEPAEPPRALRQLATLAAELSEIVIELEPGFREQCFRRISEVRPSRSWQSRIGTAILRAAAVSVGPLPALAAIAVVAVLLFPNLPGFPAKASEILAKSDRAIATLLQPGSVLLRRWHIVDRIRQLPDGPVRFVDRYTLEWIDGSDIRHATGQSVAADGRMYLAYANVLEHGQYVPRVYYGPGYADQVDGLLSIVPSRHEFESAAERFRGLEREVVETYLARGSIYEPLVSERLFNDAMFKAVTGPESLPQVLLSVDDGIVFNGTSVYRVRSVETVRVPFRWRPTGPPRMWLERRETFKYIAKDSFLTVKAEETSETENGEEIHIVRELVETRTMPMPPSGGPGDPFAWVGTVDVPVRRQSAYEQLSQVTRTLRRAPEFLARLKAATTEEH
jgi:hypothetical protein